MTEALAWGALAVSSLVIGAALAFARHWSKRQVGLVLAFGAGALISAVSFEFAQEGLELGGAGVTGLGLGVGTLTRLPRRDPRAAGDADRSMIPDARAEAGRTAGLVTVLGFALAAALSQLA
jgi:hypothetical protein